MSSNKFSFGPSRAFNNYRAALAEYFEARSRRDMAEDDLWAAEEDFLPGAPKLLAFQEAFLAAEDAEAEAHAALVYAKGELANEQEEDARLERFQPSQFSHGRDKAIAFKRARWFLHHFSQYCLKRYDDREANNEDPAKVYTIDRSKGAYESMGWGERTSYLKRVGNRKYRANVRQAMSREDYDSIPCPGATARDVF